MSINTVPIANAKHADDRLDCLVSGYIKSIQKAHKSLKTIPMDIYYVCILFLLQKEYFELIADQMNLSQDELTITKDASAIYNWKNTTYGKMVIPSISKQIVTWKIKMKPFTEERNRVIGIASSTDCIDKDYTYNKVGHYYGISDSGTRFWNHKLKEETSVETAAEYDTFEYHDRSGDTVTMILNLRDATILFGQSEHPKIAWTNIKIDKDVNYRLAVSLRCQLDSMTIVDFVEQD